MSDVEMKLDEVLNYMINSFTPTPAREKIEKVKDDYPDTDIRREMRLGLADAFDEGYRSGLIDMVKLVKSMEIDVLVGDDIAAKINDGQ